VYARGRVRAGARNKKDMKELSFEFPKDFIYSHKNDFDNGNIHYLFSVGPYLFWCDTTDGVLTHITPTLKQEIDTWYINSEDEIYNVSVDEHSIHLLDAMILNADYLAKIQNIIDMTK
jgi:hypothetical protein